jgi:hypothetical protein
VRDLVAGSGIEFEDRGLHELKGLDEPRRLFAVRDGHGIGGEGRSTSPTGLRQP